MIVSLKVGADAARVLGELVSRGLWVSHVEQSAAEGGQTHYVIAPHSAAVGVDEIAAIEGISSVSVGRSAHPLVDRQGPVVEVAGVTIGGGEPVLMCGPCSVESEAQARSIASRLAPLGVRFLRGGAYKPRTSTYAFQGHGEPALDWLRRAADATGMKVVTEALSEASVPFVAERADLVQVGSRNMQNYALLKAVGRAQKPVLLKRGMAATIEDWLSSGEYLLAAGSPAVVFCERGIRSFDDSMRNLVDMGAVALLAHVHRLPVIVDPSHGAGRRDLIVPLARAAIAAGAAGLMIETHEDPARALSDGPQAIPLAAMPATLRAIHRGFAPGGGAS
ncbi:MAG: 3-deoxy-7-phosphoheptulonate synthase [Byssovorax sp.]